MKKGLLLLIAFFTIFMVSCSDRTGFEVISAIEGKAMMDEDASIILLDVRTSVEYNNEHIEGAMLLTLDNIEATANRVIPDKTATYIIYCRSGNRSNQASELLVDMGYENIYDMGGIIDWPYDIVS